MSVNMSLVARMAQLRDVVDRTSITSADGRIFELEDGMSALCDRLVELRNCGQRLFLVGNGGSAAVAGHSVTDFFNVAKINATTLHDSSLMTCMANDYGYENAFARMLGQAMRPGDVVIAISSSGKSMNIRNAAGQAAEKGGFVVTLSGFASDNPLRSMGAMNIWLDSCDYGFVEIGHQFVLHNISDRFGAGLAG